MAEMPKDIFEAMERYSGGDGLLNALRDAERYRWLRKNGKPAAEGLVMRNPDLWDEAIDTAMKGANID